MPLLTVGPIAANINPTGVSTSLKPKVQNREEINPVVVGQRVAEWALDPATASRQGRTPDADNAEAVLPADEEAVKGFG